MEKKVKDKLIQVRVDAKLFEAVEALAAADHRNLSDFVRVQLIKLTEAAKEKKDK